jgi:hypothetical protein
MAIALGGEVCGGQVVAPGPGHSRRDRSLAVKPRPNGDILVHSHAGDDKVECLDYAREKLQIEREQRREKAVYTYCDEGGHAVLEVVRLEPKGFFQRRPGGGKPNKWTLYRLTELLEAVANYQSVFIAEGEKAVDALSRIGVVATCSPMGAGKWRDEYSQHLKGANVIILPDNDEPGRAHAEQVAKSLTGIAASVRTIALPDLPKAGDPYDWVQSGGKADALWRLIEAAPRKASSNLICLASVESVPIDWIWPGYLARGKLTLIGGDPELGKSLITIDAAARLSREDRWPPHKTRAPFGSTIFICSEDGVADTIKPRAEAAGADVNMLHVFQSSLTKNGKRKTFSLQDDLELLGDSIKEVGNAQLVVIDAITSYMGAIDSHKTADVRAVLEPLASFAEEHGVALFGVTHPPKSSQGNALRTFAGSFAFVAAPRIAHFVTTDPDNPERKLLLPVKNNIGRKAPGLGYSIGTKIVSHNIEQAHVIWDDAPVDYTADEAIAANASANSGGVERAKDLLEEMLASGPIESKLIWDMAKKEHVSGRMIKKAKEELGIKAHKGGFNEGWIWSKETAKGSI